VVGQPEIQIFAMPLPDGRRGCFPKMWQTKRPHAAKMWQTKRPHAAKMWQTKRPHATHAT